MKARALFLLLCPTRRREVRLFLVKSRVWRSCSGIHLQEECFIRDGAILLLFALAPFYLSAYHLSLLGRFLALAIVSLSLTLVWGWGGMLSLGQGVFFGLGGYALAMYLKLASLSSDDMPDFMMWSGLDRMPGWWTPFRHSGVALAAVVLVPMAAAALLGWAMFRSRVGGVYFALITQALALAFSTLLVSEQPYTGGFNGLTDFTTVLGFSIISPGFERGLYWVTVGVLALAFLLCRWLGGRSFGKVLVAIRDGENRVRFLGYNTMAYKTVAFTAGGALAGVAGALYTVHLGVISPAMVGVIPSIEMVVAVAIGGRESLIGAVIGTLLLNFGKDWISSAVPELWLFIIGGLFVLVVTVAPDGLAGLAKWRPHKKDKTGPSGRHGAEANETAARAFAAPTGAAARPEVG